MSTFANLMKFESGAKLYLKATAMVVIIVINIALDQLTKDWARSALEYGEAHEIVGRYFMLIKAENTGAFLGMGSTLDDGMKQLFLNGLPALVLVAMLVYAILKPGLSNWLIVGFSLVIGGGIGNLIDRALYQSVTDFMFMDFGIFRTGIFNVADVSVMVGVGCILVDSFLERKRNKATNDSTTPELTGAGGADDTLTNA
ncbi:MAG: signal peptidase II [Salibacteraceae bacterium]